MYIIIIIIIIIVVIIIWLHVLAAHSNGKCCVLLGRSTEEWNRLLHVVIVGGGPTGVEFAGELCDFVRQDLSRVYPNRAASVR